MDYRKALKAKMDESGIWEKSLSYNRGSFVKMAGGIDTHLYYVKEGSLRAYVISEGEENTIRFGYKDNFIAVLDSFISGKPSAIFLQAIKKTELLAVSKENYEKFLKSTRGNANLWNSILEQLILEMMERERDLLISSPAERYKRVLLRSPRLFQEIPHKYIASYLRMTPETLSRIKKS